MKILCPTCHGKGSIPDPKLVGVPMGYCGPNGEGCPDVFCQSCGGSGWVASAEKPCGCHRQFNVPLPPGVQIIWPQGVNEGYPLQTPLANGEYRVNQLSASHGALLAVD